jgi:hypothetical protein
VFLVNLSHPWDKEPKHDRPLHGEIRLLRPLYAQCPRHTTKCRVMAGPHKLLNRRADRIEWDSCRKRRRGG